MNTNRNKLIEEKTISPNKTTGQLTTACTPRTRCLGAFLVIALLCFALDSLGAEAPALTQVQQSWLSKANRHERAGWIYLHIEGGPRERGFQHGYLLAKEIAECLRVARAKWRHDSSMEWSWLIAHTKGFIEPAIDPENRAELQGIADGMTAAGVPTTYDEIVTYNAEL